MEGQIYRFLLDGVSFDVCFEVKLYFRVVRKPTNIRPFTAASPDALTAISGWNEAKRSLRCKLHRAHS